MTYTTPHTLITDDNQSDAENKHIVINCRTNTVSACDTIDLAHALAAEHDAETAAL
jgi:hypothetical protein